MFESDKLAAVIASTQQAPPFGGAPNIARVNTMVLKLFSGITVISVMCAGCGLKDSTEGAWVTIDSAVISKTRLADGESLDFSWRVSYTKDSGYVTTVGLFVGSEKAITQDASDRLRLFSRAVTGNIQNDAAESTITCDRQGSLLSCGGAGRDLPADEAHLTFRACTSYVLDTEETCEYRSFKIALR